MNSKTLRNFAYIYSTGYKRYQTALVGMCLFIIACVFYSREFFWELVATDLIVNPCIISLTIGGSIYCYSSLCGIEREMEHLFALQEDFQHGISCNEAKFNILFLIARTFNTILSERGALYINSSNELNAIVKSYVDDIESRNFYIGFASAMSVSLGLFGTFMGLTKTISSMSTLLSNLYAGLADEGADILGTMVQLIGELQAPLAGMALAFATSLLGLIGSMILGLEIILLTRAAAYAQGNLESWLALLLVPEKEADGAADSTQSTAALLDAIEKLTAENSKQMAFLTQAVHNFTMQNQETTLHQQKVLAALEKIIQQNQKL